MGAGMQRFLGRHFGDQSDAQRGLGADALIIAEQGKAQHLAKLDAARKSHRLQRGDHSEGDMRVEELRILRADEDVGLV